MDTSQCTTQYRVPAALAKHHNSYLHQQAKKHMN